MADSPEREGTQPNPAASSSEAVSGRNTRRWWTLAMSGVVLLSTIPPAAILIIYSTDSDFLANQFFAYVMCGMTMGLPWAQWGFVGVYCMLHEAPLWRRCLT
jgi:hypothetical protein